MPVRLTDPAIPQRGACMAETTRAGAALRALGALMLVALCALSVLLLMENRGAARERGALAAHRAAHVVATQFGWLFEASAQTLQHIETVLANQGSDGRGATIRSLTEAVRDLPEGLTYAVYDASGRLTHSSLPHPRPINVTDRSYFRQARAGEKLALSPMVTDRQSGERAMILARRIDGAQGFSGVITIAIPVTKLETLAAAIGLEGNSVVSLIHLDGMLLARSPPVEPMDVSQTQLFDHLALAPHGHFEMPSPADGVTRIAGYWLLDDWPVVALAGIDSATVFAGFRDTLRTAVLVALPVLFLLGWMLHHLLRVMQQEDARRIALEEANARATFLLREVHHRLKNNLQTVASLIRLEPALPDRQKQSLLGRLTAMVSIHEAMYRSDQFEEVCVAPYIERLLTDIASSHGGSVSLGMDIAHLRLPGDRAMLLGLLVNELASNAFKHAFAKRDSGRLVVSLTEPISGTLRLIVADDGPGYCPDYQSQGMGARLIEAFAAQLGGTVQIDGQGATTVTVDFPRDFREAVEPPHSLAGQTVSATGARSSAAILSSNPARSSSRT